MGLFTPRPETTLQLMNRLLDQGYVQTTGAVLQAISKNGTSGIMDRRLKELEDEAARLAAQGLKLTAENPVARALLADLADTMQANQALMNSVAEDVQLSGVQAAGPVVRQMALPGLSDQALRVAGVQWNVPNPEAVNSLVGYASSDAWAGVMSKYGDDVVDIVRRTAIQGALEGWNPVRTAREIRGLVEGLPPNYANTLMRTLQLTSFRDAGVIHRVANADILTEQIRVAALDDRTCMACIAEHGKHFPIDARIDDHYNGRCTSITVIKGRAAPDILTGPEWFERLDDAQQQEHMSGAAWAAWKAGDVQLDEFATTTTDPVFGTMVVEASLKGILGAGAKEYYQ